MSKKQDRDDYLRYRLTHLQARLFVALFKGRGQRTIQAYQDEINQIFEEMKGAYDVDTDGA